jgi:hypothetical protein
MRPLAARAASLLAITGLLLATSIAGAETFLVYPVKVSAKGFGISDPPLTPPAVKRKLGNAEMINTLKDEPFGTQVPKNHKLVAVIGCRPNIMLSGELHVWDASTKTLLPTPGNGMIGMSPFAATTNKTVPTSEGPWSRTVSGLGQARAENEDADPDQEASVIGVGRVSFAVPKAKLGVPGDEACVSMIKAKAGYGLSERPDSGAFYEKAKLMVGKPIAVIIDP